MTRFVEVSHQEWIAAPAPTVRAQFADLQHHIEARVHPSLRFEILAQRGRFARFVQEVRLLGIKQRDIFEREIAEDGATMVDTSVEGFNRGGSIRFRFTPGMQGASQATRVDVTIRLPVPRGLGWASRLLESQVRRELLAAVAQDKHDIEVRGYRPAQPAAA